MRFSLMPLFALVASAVAQNNSPNAFNLPGGTLVFQAGQSKDLTWMNKAGNTVTLTLKMGANSNLQTVGVIADHVANTGSYTWAVPANTPEGATYAIEIKNDDDPSEVNYTTQFVVQSDVKAVASGSSSGMMTGSATTGSSTGSATSGASSGSMTGSMTGSASATGSSSGMTTKTGSASSSGTASSSASRTSAASSAASGATVPTSNAGVRPAIGAAGSLLAVAAGFAIAL